MAEPDPNANKPEFDEDQGFPWAILLGIILVIGLAAAWLMHAKAGSMAVTNALEQQLAVDKTTLEAERQKVFDLTNDLAALKQKIALGKVSDQKQAVADYHKLVEEQRAQREKVQALADQYNQKVEKLHELQ